MKRLNIIDMTGSSVQIQTSAVSRPQQPRKTARTELLLRKVLKAKDEAKFNVKALVQREEYQENYKVQLQQEEESLRAKTQGS